MLVLQNNRHFQGRIFVKMPRQVGPSFTGRCISFIIFRPTIDSIGLRYRMCMRAKTVTDADITEPKRYRRNGTTIITVRMHELIRKFE